MEVSSAKHNTVLSVGVAFRSMLKQDPEVAATGLGIYPVLSESETEMPLMVYRLAGLEPVAVKNDRTSVASIVECEIWARKYLEAVAIAEKVVNALDGKRWSCGRLRVNSCTLMDASENGSEEGMYVVTLVWRLHTLLLKDENQEN